MGVSDLFSLPYLGMKDGYHTYKFEVDSHFFKNFISSPIDSGAFEIHLDVDKRGSLSEFMFSISGKVDTSCDRCLASIELPVTGTFKMHGKISSIEGDDEDIIYIKPDQSHIDLSQYIYELICLSIPQIKVYDCAIEVPKVCDEVILSKLQTETPNDIENDNPDLWSNIQGLSIEE